MASHTSPVYVEVRDRPLFNADDAGVILDIINGTLGWVRDMAAIGRPLDRARMVDLIADSAALLKDRLDTHNRRVV
jgi:hypothetical protein